MVAQHLFLIDFLTAQQNLLLQENLFLPISMFLPSLVESEIEY